MATNITELELYPTPAYVENKELNDSEREVLMQKEAEVEPHFETTDIDSGRDSPRIKEQPDVVTSEQAETKIVQIWISLRKELINLVTRR